MSENFINRSTFLSRSSEFRSFEISNDDVVTRQDNYNEFIVLTKNKEAVLSSDYSILSVYAKQMFIQNFCTLAGANDKMKILDFSFDLNNRYTFWSGIIGGTFLMLSYFGTDQSQVQRYLSGKSLKEMQLGLIFNGLLKVPMQFFILLVGVMVFVFYQFNQAPMNFNPTATDLVLNSKYAEEYKSLQLEQGKIFEEKQTYITAYNTSETEALKNDIKAANTAYDNLRKEGKILIEKASKDKKIKVESNDKDYVFIHFILNNLPRGLIGLLLAVILSAAMSSTSSELNALASTTTIDLYKRNTAEKSETEMVKVSRWFTLAWGLIAIGVACVANLAENLIQLVNIIGSIFYGNVLGNCGGTLDTSYSNIYVYDKKAVNGE